jgi:hypothetical protein
VLKPEVRNPIIGQVFLHCARRTRRSLRLSVIHVEAKSISAHDGVEMGRGDTRVDDRIGPLNDDRGFTWQAPESSDGRYGQGQKTKHAENR